MKELTGLFRKGIENGTDYVDYDVQEAVNTLPDISCDLDDGDFSPDDERLDFIYEKIPYITPYSFTFDEIR